MIEIAVIVAIVVTLIAARPLGERFSRWLERREREALARDLAEADALYDRLFNDPHYAVAFVRQRFPEEHEMIADLEKRAADGAPWLPGDWSDERV